MSESLGHSPAQIVAQLLIDLGIGSVPGSGLAWPVYDSSLPDEPDSAICVYDTTGIMDARMASSGEWNEHHGINIRLRTTGQQAGATKINALIVALDTQVDHDTVNMTTPTNVYDVENMSRRSGPFDNGPEPESGRRIFTVNYVASIRQVS